MPAKPTTTHFGASNWAEITERITEIKFIIKLPNACYFKFSKAFKPRSKTKLILTGIRPNANAERVMPK